MDNPDLERINEEIRILTHCVVAAIIMVGAQQGREAAINIAVQLHNETVNKLFPS